MPNPISPRQNIFPVEAYARYMEWSGASAFEADIYAAGKDRADPSVFPEHPEWMPLNEATGRPHSAAEFRQAMSAFTEHLPGGYDVWGFGGKDPFARVGSIGREQNLNEAPIASVDPVVLGLTGGRGAGKSFLCNELAELGFVRVHPFSPGKAMLRGFYVFHGATEEQALAMTDGSLKDRPAPAGVLPVDPETGHPYTSRFVMERLGQFLAIDVGLDSTIGRELAHWAATGAQRLLVDSVVYEEPIIRKMTNSVILCLKKAGGLAGNDIVADITDGHVARVRVDGVLVNHMEGRERLMADFHELMAQAGFNLDQSTIPVPAI